MPKGNHVFNDFDGVIEKSLGDALSPLGCGKKISAYFGGQATEDERREMEALVPNAIRWVNEIKAHEHTQKIHEIQDDEQVEADDPNSLAFGRAASEFREYVMKFAMGIDSITVMDKWRVMVNLGVDRDAWRHYVNDGSSAVNTPRSKGDRERRCQEVEKFIKGDLTRLVAQYLFALRMDLKKSGKIDYEETLKASKAGLLRKLEELQGQWNQ